ncbi:MAG: TolC family protein [Pirellulaceae bacterium]
MKIHSLPFNAFSLSGVFTLIFLVVAFGCSRTKYRRAADAESYCLINSRQSDPLWDVPNRPVEPRQISRMYVAAEQDCGPKPLDDAAAKRYMDHPDCKDNTGYYSQIPTRIGSENPSWIASLPRGADGQIKLTQPLAQDLALIHSRDYQSEFERVYLTALSLSSNRFEFDTQWAGGLGGAFTATGADLGDARDLDITLNRLGMRRNLASGGQFATSVLNNVTWDFGNGGFQNGSASLVTTFTQPLLRGAFRHVRLEDLTQAERNLLYSVRDFARFRRLFYVDVSTSYLNLLTQLQAIRNLQTNVENLRQNLTEFDFYVQLRTATQIQRDQVFQQYQNGRLSLLAAEQDYASSMDQFRFQLGLPAWVPLEIDESLLEQFELSNVELVDLQNEAQSLFVSLMQYLPPETASREQLLDACQRFAELRERVAEALPEIEDEFLRWSKSLSAVDTEALGTDDRLDYNQQRSLAERIETQLIESAEMLEVRDAAYDELVAQVNQLYDEAEKAQKELGSTNQQQPTPDSLPAQQDATPSENAAQPQEINLDDLLAREKPNPKVVAWQAVQDAVGNQLRSEAVEIFLIQTQIRLFLIEIDPIPPLKSEAAITYAFQNRLDLKNSQAQVVDAFRKVEVAADALESDLSLQGGVTIGSDPTQNSPYRFDSSANRYTVGVQFDGPLNRLNERNTYRAQQIAYQQATRGYMAAKDGTANELRSILRRLELSRLNFQIARQQVVAATRQVDEAQINLRSGGESESVTLFLLQALQGILDAKNNLISNWIAYRVQKMQLFAALELLYLDENGQWINEDQELNDLIHAALIDPEYFPLGVATADREPEQIPEQTPNADDADDAEVKPADNEQGPTDQNSAELVEPTEVSFRPGVVLPTVPIDLQFR